MRVGELSRRTGAGVRSLRHDEECGLISPSRSGSGQRLDDEAMVDRVLLVRQLLAAGLGTAAIADVLPCLADPATRTASLTRRLIAERDRLDREIDDRRTTRSALQQIIDTAPPLRD